MGDLTKNFSESEFACKCCGEVKVDMELVSRLQRMRDAVGKPIKIISGYRCPKHNAEVGGARTSMHLYGKAADIKVGRLDVWRMFALAEQFFYDGGIGIYPEDGFIHVDVRSRRARWAKIKGRYVSIAEAVARYRKRDADG